MPDVRLPSPRWRWDLFCRVVDNHGDAGVCWRLAADLAARGQSVRLWIDDDRALRWMAPDGAPGVEVRRWPSTDAEAEADATPGDVVVEAFGCDPPPAFVAAMAHAAARGAAPTWLNLEYLSAEPYVERSHGLRSPQTAGPGRGLDKWFFYPGFTDATGGLLREPGRVAALDALDRAAWRRAHGLALADDERLATVFCYPGSDLARLADALARGGGRWCLATAPGPATDAAAALAGVAPGGVRTQALPWLPQRDYDDLLAAADLNLVRGEDSFVRAQWAGRPFVWQIYRQDDGVHADKLAAFLDRLAAGSGLAADDDAGRAWRHLHRAWNGLDDATAPWPAWTPARHAAVATAARRWRDVLVASPDLVTRLLAFVGQRR